MASEITNKYQSYWCRLRVYSEQLVDVLIVILLSFFSENYFYLLHMWLSQCDKLKIITSWKKRYLTKRSGKCRIKFLSRVKKFLFCIFDLFLHNKEISSSLYYNFAHILYTLLQITLIFHYILYYVILITHYIYVLNYFIMFSNLTNNVFATIFYNINLNRQETHFLIKSEKVTTLKCIQSTRLVWAFSEKAQFEINSSIFRVQSRSLWFKAARKCLLQFASIIEWSHFARDARAWHWQCVERRSPAIWKRRRTHTAIEMCTGGRKIGAWFIKVPL